MSSELSCHARPCIEIDCSADPSNIAPVVAAVLAVIAGVRLRATPERPCVILLAESHHDILELAIQLAVIDAISGWRGDGLPPLAVGLEEPHDQLARELGLLGYPLPPAAGSLLAGLDPDGALGIAAMHAFSDKLDAPETQFALDDLCLRRGLSVQLNDAAHDGRHLDLAEPLTRSLAPPFHVASRPLAIGSRGGMATRNACIVEKSVQHMRRTGACVYLQRCGEYHAAGDRDDLDPRYGLVAGYEARGIGVIPIFRSEVLADLTPVAAARIREGIVYRGLATACFGPDGCPSSAAAELAALADLFGRAALPLELADRSARVDELEGRVLAEAAGLAARAAAIVAARPV